MEIVWSVNRSWIYDSYFSLYRPIHPGKNVRGEMSRLNFPNTGCRCRMKIRPAWKSVRITLNIDIDGPYSAVIGSPDQLQL